MSPTTPNLPAPGPLERVCKGLATLDAVLCDEWDYRYYSFNSAWDLGRGERMASMRDGSGDSWFLVFASGMAFLKAFWHEYPREERSKVYSGLPAALSPQLVEPAFSMEEVTLGGWHDGTSWTFRGNGEPMANELAILSGSPEVYCEYASTYFEVEIPAKAVARVLAGERLDDELLRQLGGTRTLAELAVDLREIGY